MAVLINFKICDNAEACNAIRVCPTKAFYWDAENKTLAVDEDKCINCGLCAESSDSCQVGAIRFAKTEEEYQKIKKEIEDDSRTVADLMADRYGGQPINMPFYCEENEIDEVLTTSKLCLIELFNAESIECLIKSIPIKTILNNINQDVLYRKVEVKSNTIISQHNIKELPSLLLFKNNKLLGKIEGYYTNDDKEKLLKEINKIVKNWQ